jgi:hypothetical protein
MNNVAPAELIQEAYKVFNPQIDAPNLDPRLKKALLCLSVEGHAQSGHSVFNSTKYPNTTILDILNSVEDSKTEADKVRETVSKSILSTKKSLEELTQIYFGLKKVNSSLLYNSLDNTLSLRNIKTGNPIFGFNQMQNIKIPNKRTYILSALRGAMKASMMDSDSHRKKTVERFKFTLDGGKLNIGGGTCHVGNIEILRKHGISISDLSEFQQSEEKINWLYQKKCLLNVTSLDSKHFFQTSSELLNVYIRTKDGHGCCDDLSLIKIGLDDKHLSLEHALIAHQFGRELDRVDTFDKVSKLPVTGGSDEYIGRELSSYFKQQSRISNAIIFSDYLLDRKKYRVSSQELFSEVCGNMDHIGVRNYLHKTTGSIHDLSEISDELFPSELVSNSEIQEVIYFGAKGNTPKVYGSTSVRYFEANMSSKSRITTQGKICENFIRTGSMPTGYKIGFTGISSQELLEITQERINGFQLKGLLPENLF